MWVASLTLSLSFASAKASAGPPPPTLARNDLRARYNLGHAAGYDVEYYRIIAKQCGALTPEGRLAQHASVRARMLGFRGEYQDEFFWDAFDQGKLDARKDALKAEGELCTCRNPSNFYNQSLACDTH